MPSSTSNSDSHADAADLELPRRSLLKVGGASLAAASMVVAGIEVASRELGFRPELRDSADLWCDVLEQARQLGERAFAIVGTSRSQLGVDPALLRPLPHGLVPLQLAISGSAALPVLEELAADARFRGTVLCEVMPQSFFALSSLRAESVPWLAYARARPAAAPAESFLRKHAQERVVCIQPPLDMRVVVRRLVTGQGLPPQPYFHVRPDRFVEADYSKTDAAGLLARRVAVGKGRTRPPESAVRTVIGQVRSWCRAIAARGGRVVFLRMISSLGVREQEDATFPRELFWDRLLRDTGCEGLYDSELPGVAGLICPDGSHLNATQARTFTRSLRSAMTERQML